MVKPTEPSRRLQSALIRSAASHVQRRHYQAVVSLTGQERHLIVEVDPNSRRAEPSAALAGLLLDYASGALPPAQSLVVETHLRLRPMSHEGALEADVLGGALLEAIEPAPLRTAPLAAGRPKGRAARASLAWRSARARIGLAYAGGEGLAWRRRLIGHFEHALPIKGAFLLRIPAGRAMPRHGHTGEELTLVLRGAFEDEDGRYEPGDLALADSEMVHKPRADPGEACVCLVAATGGRTLLEPLVNLFGGGRP